MLVIGAMIIGGIVWTIGSFTTLSDLLKNGNSLEEYREKYGHDLGMLVCCTYRGMMIAAWPVMGLGGFGIGIIRDSIRLSMRRPQNNNK